MRRFTLTRVGNRQIAEFDRATCTPRLRLVGLSIVAFLFLARLPAAAEPTALLDAKRFSSANFPSNVAGFDFAGQSLSFSASIGDGGDWGYAGSGARMRVPGQLELKLRVQGELRHCDQNAVGGVFVDYGSPSGYQTRVLFAVGPPPAGREDVLPPWGKGSPPDRVVPVTIAGDGAVTLDLTPHAPNGWDGTVWLSVFVENTGKGTTLSATLDNVVDERGRDTAPKAAEADMPAWNLVPLEGRTWYLGKMDEVESLALLKLRERMPSVAVTASLTEEAQNRYRAGKPSVYVGHIDEPSHGVSRRGGLARRQAERRKAVALRSGIRDSVPAAIQRSCGCRQSADGPCLRASPPSAQPCRTS